jgi:YidC/Oxa1 family membrane protein insertase
MDRTGIIVVFVCLALMVAIETMTPKVPPPVRPAATAAAPVTSLAPAAPAPPASAPASPAVPKPTEPGATPAPVVSAPAAPVAPPAPQPLPEQITQIENGPVRVTFTSKGAAVKEVALLQHSEANKDGVVVLNENAQANILALDGWLGAGSAGFQATPSAQGVTYTTTLGNGVRWTRTYVVNGDYTISAVDQLTNPGAAAVTLPAFSLATGRAQPIRVEGHYQPISNRYLAIAWFNGHLRLVTVDYFNSTMFSHGARDSFSSAELDAPSKGIFDDIGSLFFVSSAAPAQALPPMRWIATENQFFTVLITPTADHLIDHATLQAFNTRDDRGNVPPEQEPDLEAAAFFPAVTLAPGQSTSLRYQIYAGPKEYWRLSRLDGSQQELLNYGIFEPVVVLMLHALHFFHHHVGNYGVAIILLTLVIKTCTWPLQSMANRSGKRMQALAPKIKEVQAKFKDQPEKVGAETMALYKDYGVNPLAGCIPALVQMPVFLSLVYMLQNAVELRHQSFLWVHDLTLPDTVASWTLPGPILFGISHIMINPLPLMVTGLTMVMMRMTPQIGDPQQAKIAQFMPLVFLVFFYNFAAALSLYYVINNCVSIVQIYRNLKKPLPELKKREK